MDTIVKFSLGAAFVAMAWTFIGFMLLQLWREFKK